jgi:type I restriction enzyme S subunit
VLPLYLTYALNSPAVRKRTTEKVHGVGRPRINLKEIKEIELPVAPTSEQKRITEQIDVLFTDLDSAIAALKRVQANLKRYRASVLKAACEGRLVTTEAELARKKRRTYETGEQLLARIHKDRRAKWESDQLAKMLATGKPPQNDEWKKKYKEPAPPDTTNLPQLPEGWTWARGGQLFVWSSGEFLPQSEMIEGAVPVFGGNGITGYHSQSLVQEPTLVIGRVGALCGNACVTPGPAWITDNAIYATWSPTTCDLGYLELTLTAANLNTLAAGVGQPFVNQRMLNDLCIPLPPAAEQRDIVAEAEIRFSNTHQVTATLVTDLVRASRLRESILKRAFEGKLVPQDPNDEPASVLLERIRAERSEKQPVPRTIRRPSTRKAKGVTA